MDNKGQISLELVVILAAVLIVAYFVIKALKTTSKTLTKKESSAVSKVSKILK